MPHVAANRRLGDNSYQHKKAHLPFDRWGGTSLALDKAQLVLTVGGQYPYAVHAPDVCR